MKKRIHWTVCAVIGVFVACAISGWIMEGSATHYVGWALFAAAQLIFAAFDMPNRETSHDL